jgi:hypothetical protein
MLSSFYSPQAFTPQFLGLPGGGLSHMNPAYFSQPGVYGGISPGYELGHAGAVNPFLGYPQLTQPQFLQFSHSPFGQSPFAALNPLAMIQPGLAMNPYLQSQVHPYLQSQVHPYFLGQSWQVPVSSTPFNSFGGQPAGSHIAHIVPALAQLAQQISAQSVLTQQTGIALYQLVQQLAAQSVHAYPGTGIGAGHSPFATSAPGAYPGFAQTPAWGANRAQTIQ